jgi:hypothetical protein
MDPQKTPVPSPDGDKSTENIIKPTGSEHVTEDPKSWGDNTSADASSESNSPAMSSSDAAPVTDGSPAEVSASNSTADMPADTASPVANSASVSGSDAPAVDVPAPATPAEAIPGLAAATETPTPPTPTTPAWPAAGGADGNVGMPASAAMGGVHKPAPKGVLIGLIIALVVLVLGGGAAAAYFGYVVPNQPENVLKAALRNTFDNKKVTSEHFNGKVSVKDKETNTTLSATFNGGANNAGAVQITADLDAVVTKVTLDARSVDGSTYYLKVGGLDGLPELLNAYAADSGLSASEISAYSSLISGLNDQWIEINQSILSQLGLGDTGTLKITSTDRDKIAKAYANHQFLSITQTLADESISSMPSHHYKVTINKTELKNFLVALKDAKVESIKITQDDITSLDNSVKNIDFNKYPVDVWIAKDTKLIDQVTFTYSDDQATLNIRYTIADYNKPVTVTKPTGAKSLLEILSELYGGAGSSSALMNELQGSGISL